MEGTLLLPLTYEDAGSVLPSATWPSDHLPLVASLSLPHDHDGGHTEHGDGCGCLPPGALSLFEMADLRKEYRRKLKEKEEGGGTGVDEGGEKVETERGRNNLKYLMTFGR